MWEISRSLDIEENTKIRIKKCTSAPSRRKKDTNNPDHYFDEESEKGLEEGDQRNDGCRMPVRTLSSSPSYSSLVSITPSLHSQMSCPANITQALVPPLQNTLTFLNIECTNGDGVEIEGMRRFQKSVSIDGGGGKHSKWGFFSNLFGWKKTGKRKRKSLRQLPKGMTQTEANACGYQMKSDTSLNDSENSPKIRDSMRLRRNSSLRLATRTSNKGNKSDVLPSPSIKCSSCALDKDLAVPCSNPCSHDFDIVPVSSPREDIDFVSW